MNQPAVKVRHSTFTSFTGVAVRETVKKDGLHGIEYPACEVIWDRPSALDTIVANYNLIFIVPAVSALLP